MQNGQSELPGEGAHPSALTARGEARAVQDLVDGLDELYIAIDATGRCCGWNRVSAATFGLAKECVLGRRVQELFPRVDLSALTARVNHCLRQGAAETFEYTTRSLDEARILRVRVVPLRGEVRIFARDVTSERCACAALEALAAEREAMLREQHHRLKNDLQLVNSMLNRQLRHIESPEVARVLEETQARVRAMARVHELLAYARSVDALDAGPWVSAIARGCCDAHPASRRPLLVVSASPITLSAAAAGRLGCLVSELVSNALHHAWPARAPGTLRVNLARREGLVALEVEDDGVGLPEDPAARRPGRLGLCLAVQFARQLGAKLELTSPRGTLARVLFPEELRR